MTTDKHELHGKISLETIARQLLDTLQNTAPPSLLKCTRNVENTRAWLTPAVIKHPQWKIVPAICWTASVN